MRYRGIVTEDMAKCAKVRNITRTDQGCRVRISPAIIVRFSRVLNIEQGILNYEVWVWSAVSLYRQR